MGYRRSHYRRGHIRNTKYGKVYVSATRVRACQTNAHSFYSPNTNSDNSSSKGGKNKGSLLIIFIFTAFIVLIGCLVGNDIHKQYLYKKELQTKEVANALEEYWINQFTQYDQNTFVKLLREESGLSDLDLEFSPKQFYHHYGENNNFFLELIVSLNFISNEIDNYYTEQYEGPESLKLLHVLRRLKKACYGTNNHFSYANSLGTVYCTISDETNFSKDLHVTTANGRQYRYSYLVGYEVIEIDNNTVYRERVNASEVGISGNPDRALTKEEADALKGTGYHNTRPGSMAESIELGAAQAKCKICGMHTDNGSGSKCDYCIKKYGY